MGFWAGLPSVLPELPTRRKTFLDIEVLGRAHIGNIDQAIVIDPGGYGAGTVRIIFDVTTQDFEEPEILGLSTGPGITISSGREESGHVAASISVTAHATNPLVSINFAGTSASFNNSGFDMSGSNLPIIAGGGLRLLVKTTTGDPSSPTSGDTYVNEFDNVIRTYADGAWRDLATW